MANCFFFHPYKWSYVIQLITTRGVVFVHLLYIALFPKLQFIVFIKHGLYSFTLCNFKLYPSYACSFFFSVDGSYLLDSISIGSVIV